METTIYIRKDRQKTGVGKKLYEALEKVLHAQNICNLYACIGYPEIEDEYLTKNSAQFHAHLGYRMVGEFYHCGYKFDRWYNMVWMEKLLDPEVKHPKPIKWMEENREELEAHIVQSMFIRDKVRPYRTNNLYAEIQKKIKEQEELQLEQQHSKGKA